MKERFRFTLYVKDTDTVFAEGIPPGVLVIEDVTFDTGDTKGSFKNVWLAESVRRYLNDMVDKYIGVRVEDCEKDNTGD